MNARCLSVCFVIVVFLWAWWACLACLYKLSQCPDIKEFGPIYYCGISINTVLLLLFLVNQWISDSGAMELHLTKCGNPCLRIPAMVFQYPRGWVQRSLAPQLGISDYRKILLHMELKLTFLKQPPIVLTSFLWIMQNMDSVPSSGQPFKCPHSSFPTQSPDHGWDPSRLLHCLLSLTFHDFKT